MYGLTICSDGTIVNDLEWG